MTTGQYQVFRFAPDPVRDEPLNIGLTMVGEFSPLVDFPDEALERAARWCRGLDQAGLVAMREALIETVKHSLTVTEDLGQRLRLDFLGEMFGPITLSETRWVDVEPGEAHKVFEFLRRRLVVPPKPVQYGGGAPASKKIVKTILPGLRQQWHDARAEETLIARSGRPFQADVYAGGPNPLIVSTLALSSSWQGIRSVEAKAFELYDVGRSLNKPTLVACCQFPAIDTEGVQEQAKLVFQSIDVQVVTPETVGQVAKS